MFNFFQKKHNEETNESQLIYEDQTQVCITYLVNKDEKDVKIDISLEDYSDETLDKLCSILDVLSNEAGYIETVNILKNGLMKNGDESAMMKVLMHIGKQASKQFVKQVYDQVKNQPCIRPSDML